MELSKDLGMLRLGAAVPDLRVADVKFNAARIIEMAARAGRDGVQVLIFPEMGITGYTIGDLVQQGALLFSAREALLRIAEETSREPMLIVLGTPLEFENKIFNCAVALGSGRILGIIPKTYLPTYKEYYEQRWFASSRQATVSSITLGGQNVPVGTDLLFALRGIPGAVVGIEVCEDLWGPLAPHEFQAAAGATILLNISASNELIGKADWRRTMIASESGRCSAAYCYTSAGIGESSNDIVFGGHVIIAENGTILRESQRLSLEAQLVVADIDLERLTGDRRMVTGFRENFGQTSRFRAIEVDVRDPAPAVLNYDIDPHPFVPRDPPRRAERCRDLFSMQVAGLAKKLTGSGLDRVVLGVSGGLDSTLALLVAVKTMDFLGLPRENVHASTLPGFGTTARTRRNATKLCRALGVTCELVDISRACEVQLRNLKHVGEEDIVFENVQARYRTAFLFNKANELRAIMLGTGDLTEAALGWATFGGDHISHYHVNASVPKTLVQYLVRWVADEELAVSPARKALYDILATPISPELRRPLNGEIAQKSEEIVGPVELADFYLYPFIRFGMRPGKILYLADQANTRGLFEKSYTLDELYRWLRSFLERFFANQFKRTCLPEGPKIGTVSLSPRGDWRMPSEARATTWLEELETMYRRLKTGE